MAERAEKDYSPLGVDLTFGGIKIVQFRVEGEHLHVSSYVRTHLPCRGELTQDEERQLVRTLREAVGSGEFHGRKAVASLPGDIVDIRTLMLPQKEEGLDKVLRWEAESYLPYEIDDAILDHVVLGESESGEERRAEVLVAAARKEQVEHFLDLLARAGLKTIAVDIAPLALFRLLRAQVIREAPRPTALVDIGAASTTALVTSGSQLRLSRLIHQGGCQITQTLAQGLSIPPEEAEILKLEQGLGRDERGGPSSPEAEAAQDTAHVIYDILREPLEHFADEIKKLFRYFSAQERGAQVGKIFLVGGGGSLRGLDTLLHQATGVEVEVVRNVNHLVEPSPGKDEKRPGGAFAVAAGLALRGVV